MTQHNSSPGGLLIGYCRVSTAAQNPDRQLETSGPVDRVFIDKASGKSGAPRRGLEDCTDCPRDGDEPRVTSMGRLAHSLIDLRQLVAAPAGARYSAVLCADRSAGVRHIKVLNACRREGIGHGIALHASLPTAIFPSGPAGAPSFPAGL